MRLTIARFHKLAYASRRGDIGGGAGGVEPPTFKGGEAEPLHFISLPPPTLLLSTKIYNHIEQPGHEIRTRGRQSIS